eukprot:TRINITY_DN717_c1_g3_i3.p1 TRINITY_DN717_c1_g3~~TRINITY_DN717_c1_g3_i3.p1  ORF type:complete len:287 (+),score=34.10 TRINITY_DN717_c1_g3_i3:33-863(+)
MSVEDEAEREEEMGYVVYLPQFRTSILSPAWISENLPPVEALNDFHSAIPHVAHAVRYRSQVVATDGVVHPLWVIVDQRTATGTTAAITPDCFMGNDHNKVPPTAEAGNYVRVASGPVNPFGEAFSKIPPSSVILMQRPIGCELIAVKLTSAYPLKIPVPFLFIPSARHLVVGQKGVISGYPSPGIIHDPVLAKIKFYSRVYCDQYAQLIAAGKGDRDIIAFFEKTVHPTFAEFAALFNFGFHLHHSPAELLTVCDTNYARGGQYCGHSNLCRHNY